MCIFSPLSNTVYEWVEWMWRISEQSRMDVENEQAECTCMWTISEEDKVFTFICKKKFLKYTHMSFCFVLMIM